MAKILITWSGKKADADPSFIRAPISVRDGDLYEIDNLDAALIARLCERLGKKIEQEKPE